MHFEIVAKMQQNKVQLKDIYSELLWFECRTKTKKTKEQN